LRTIVDVLKRIMLFVRAAATSLKLRVKFFQSYKSGYSFEELLETFDENLRYDFFRCSYVGQIPSYVRRHRRYFSKSGRGFGEDAMHAMWWKILVDFQPTTMLEIGVYRGQTISLWSLIGKQEDFAKLEIWGLSPLVGAGDSVSAYGQIDYRNDIEENFKVFDLTSPNLFQAYSNETKGVEFISSKVWDLIYIDGSHDLDIVRQDVSIAAANLRKGGILVMDDASLYSEYRPPKSSFAGHPGPSIVAIEIESGEEFSLVGTCSHNRIYMKSKANSA
jgi:hypothetical protein